MRLNARISLVALVVGASPGSGRPRLTPRSACRASRPSAARKTRQRENPANATPARPAQLFTQAGGHPNFGITDFTFNEFGTAGDGVKTIRTDLPVGFSTNPQALPLCSMTDFEANFGKIEDQATARQAQRQAYRKSRSRCRAPRW